MSFYSIVVQVLTLIWLVALAFPQRDWSSNVIDDAIIFDNNDEASSTTQRTINNNNNTNNNNNNNTNNNCPCIATAEYNPVCGTDNVTYWNIGRFNCAKNCNPRKYYITPIYYCSFFVITLNLLKLS